MLLPLSWLKEYVDIDESPEIIANKLLSVGFEVEGIEYKGDDIKKVVVGKIVKIDPHTNSDHMVICQIDVGEEKGGVVQIVTGANNVFEGALVPAALVGAHLPNGIQIKKAKLRGVESYGMLCSGQELNITEADYEGASVNGIMILKDDAVIGQDIVDYLDMKEVIF
ncbi:MAG: phenylalanine--tRNA ligase subunit beta, partial [Clostridia bacterium]|nr:phenylalanine--tRNA ligase subunit beta [Clostridia bacterium]